jgi:hypothetical protein
MAGAAWATPEVLERLFRDSFDSKGFVREGAVPVLAKGTFAVVFKVRASAREKSPRSSSMKRCAHASQKHHVQLAAAADAHASGNITFSNAHGSCQSSWNLPWVGSFINKPSLGWEAPLMNIQWVGRLINERRRPRARVAACARFRV